MKLFALSYDTGNSMEQHSIEKGKFSVIDCVITKKKRWTMSKRQRVHN